MVNKRNQLISPYLGWLAPDGRFTPAAWGMHEDMAWMICEYMGWKEEFVKEGYSAGDYLVKKREYLLLDDPSSSGVLQITGAERMTKRQEDFLWDILAKIDDRRAGRELLLVLHGWN